jgi:threonine synthase
VSRLLSRATSGLLAALRRALSYLLANARRANPKRDRRTGRLRTGLAVRTLTREALATRPASMWRYEEVMPGAPPVTLGEGMTPLLRASRLGQHVGLDRLYIKDEGQNPTASFKARGLSAAVTMARALGVDTIALPTAGNAGGAAAAYAARAGLRCVIAMPSDTPGAIVLECRAFGADVHLIDGLISDCGAFIAQHAPTHGWFEVSTLKEPYRIEGKKTMAYELAEQLGWRWPDWIIYPTGGGTGIVGMWKAFEELEAIGWVSQSRRPRMVSVQAAGCAPIVRAYVEDAERAMPWEQAHTIADGLRVPRAIGDFLILRTIRESGGTAVSVSDADMIEGMRDLGRLEGVSAAPEGGAALHAIRSLVGTGVIRANDLVVLFNTGGALKYLEVV